MKKLFPAIFFACISLSASAQLTLQQQGRAKTVQIPFGSTITIKLPSVPPDSECDCYHSFSGKLHSVGKGEATLDLVSDTHIFPDGDEGDYKNVATEYYASGGQNLRVIPIRQALSITKHNKFDPKILGGLLILGSALHGVVFAPLIQNDNSRKVSDRIVWAGVGAGVVLALLPNKKHYHFTDTGKPGRKQWRIVVP
jgi:hypothetical protein